MEFLGEHGGPVPVELSQVTYCPTLMANLVSAPILMAQGHTILENFSGVRTKDGRVLQLRKDSRGFPYFVRGVPWGASGCSAARNKDPREIAMFSAKGPEQVQDFLHVAGSQVDAAILRASAVESADGSTQTTGQSSSADDAAVRKQQLKMLQHRSLAHLNEGSMNLIARKGLATGMSIDPAVLLQVCGPCQKGKSTRVPLKAGGPGGAPGPSQNVPTSTYVPVGDAARREPQHFADMYGPVSPKSTPGGYNQLLGVIEAQTGVMSIIPQKDKTRVLQGLQWYHTNVMPMQALRTDNDQVFKSQMLQDWCAANGVQFTHSAAYTPEQLAAIERQWRTLGDAVRTLLDDSGLPGDFWVLAAQYSVYVRNRCPRVSINGPAILEGCHRSRCFHLRCLMWVPCGRSAARRSCTCPRRGVRRSWSRGQWRRYLWACRPAVIPTYKLWVPASWDNPGAAGRLYESRDVRFDPGWTLGGVPRVAVQSGGADCDGEVVIEPPAAPPVVPEAPVPAQEEQQPQVQEEIQPLAQEVRPRVRVEVQPLVREEQPLVREGRVLDPPQVLRRSGRLEHAKKPDQEWFMVTGRTDVGVSATTAHVSYFESDDEDADGDGGVQGDSGSGVAFFTSVLESSQAAFFTGKGAPAARLPNPKSLADALSGAPDKVAAWQRSRTREFTSLHNRGVYEVVPAAGVPRSATVLRIMEIFKYKYDKAGSPTEKTRAVCLGNRQLPGRDYSETYAPVARFTTIRLLCSIAAAQGWELRQFDVETAFLYAPLEEENLYVRPPEDFRVGSDGQEVLWHLKKSLYGLKQAPKNWYGTFTSFLVDECGFTKSEHDPCLLMAYNSVGALDCAIAVYVDDVPAGVANPVFYADFIVKVRGKFNLTEGPLEWCLGIEVIQSPGRVELRQTQFIETILERFQHQDCHSAALPLDPGSKWSVKDSPKTPAEKMIAEGEFQFRNFNGSVLYLAVATRPDLAYPCSKMGHVQSKPGKVHNSDAKHLLHYLQGTKHLGLVYTGGLANANVLDGYVDASWGDCVDTFRSTTGFCFMLNGGAVSWFSKKQTTVAQSTTESEYISTAPAACEAVSLRAIAKELCIEQMEPTVLYEDNYGCVQLTKDEVLHKKTKHVNVKYHKIRELVRNKVVRIQQVPTNEQTADILTKLFSSAKKLEYLRSRILGYSPLSQ